MSPSEVEFHALTSSARGRLGRPGKWLWESLKDCEIVPVPNLYRSPLAQQYLQQREQKGTVPVVANRRTDKGGYVYALQLPEYPDCIKIGSAYDVSMRIATLSTAVPTDFGCAARVAFEDCRCAELLVHQHLQACRVRDDREWFRCTVDRFHSVVEEISASGQAAFLSAA
jgi:hypothetical protein